MYRSFSFRSVILIPVVYACIIERDLHIGCYKRDVRLVWNVFSLVGFADGTRQVLSEGAHRVPQRSVRHEVSSVCYLVSVTSSVCHEVSVTPSVCREVSVTPSVCREVSVTPSVCREVSVTPSGSGISFLYDLGCRL